MPVISVKVVGADIVRAGLENLRKRIPAISRTRIREAMQTIITRMQRYPPPRPGQKYVRTYTLQGSWKLSSLPKGYAIASDAVSPKGRHYTKWVVGDARGNYQARIHRGRWQKFKDTTEAVLSRLPKTIVAALRVGGRKL